MTAYLFVYGTLLSASQHAMAVQLRGRGRLLGIASLRGTLYDMGEYPALVDGEGFVWGELFQTDDSELLSQLDAYEGALFRRQERWVQCGGGGEIRAWVYRYRGRIGAEPVFADGRFPPQRLP